LDESLYQKENIPFRNKSDVILRKDIIYYNPGNEKIWDDKYENIPSGNGKIIGKIYIDDKPANLFEFSFIIADGKITKKAKVKYNGEYCINIKKGTYYLNGLAVYNNVELIRNKIFVNKIVKEEDFESKLLMPISDKPYILEDFHYREPVKIVFPIGKSIVELKKLKFRWEKYLNAESYKIDIYKIKKDIDGSVSFNQAISLGKLLKCELYNSEIFGKNFELILKKITPGKKYGFRITAYDKSGNILSASSDNPTVLSQFNVKKE
jgi:hypothetical protein